MSKAVCGSLLAVYHHLHLVSMLDICYEAKAQAAHCVRCVCCAGDAGVCVCWWLWCRFRPRERVEWWTSREEQSPFRRKQPNPGHSRFKKRQS